MGIRNPCCCSLQTGTIAVAILNIIVATVSLVFAFLGFVGIGIGLAWLSVEGFENSSGQEFDEDTSNLIGVVAIVILVIFFLACVVHLIMSIYLYIGAKKRNLSKCRAWFIMSTVLLCLYVLSGISKMVTAGSIGAGKTVLTIFIEVLVLTLIDGYQIYVVYAFIQELKNERLGGGERSYGYVETPPMQLNEGGVTKISYVLPPYSYDPPPYNVSHGQPEFTNVYPPPQPNHKL